MLKNILKTAAVVAFLSVTASLAHADETVTVGTGKAKLGANIQYWFVNDTSLGHFTNANGTPQGAKLNMRLRRVEMKLSGNVTDSTKYYIMIDPAATALLRDAWIAHQFMMPELELQVGQFKQLTDAESLDPSGELMFPERSMIARIHGEKREPGVMITYKTPMWKLGASMSNGHGINADDSDRSAAGAPESHANNKDLHIRLDVKPMEMVSFGAWTQMTDFSYGDTSKWGANIRLMPIEDLVLRAEGVRAYKKYTAAGAVVGALTDKVPQNGYVIDAGYTYGDWQPVARWEMAQNGTSLTNNATGTALTLGLNYYMAKHNSKIQFAYSFLNNVAGSSEVQGTSPTTATGEYGPARGDVKGGLAVLAFQAAL